MAEPEDKAELEAEAIRQALLRGLAERFGESYEEASRRYEEMRAGGGGE